MAFRVKNEEKAARSVFVSFDESSSLLINDLSLKPHFRKFGPIIQTGVQKSYAIIEFEDKNSALRCLQEPVQNCMGIQLKMKPRESKSRDRTQHSNNQNTVENDFICSLFANLRNCDNTDQQVHNLMSAYLDDGSEENENSIYLHGQKICEIIEKIVFRYRSGEKRTGSVLETL